MNVCELLVAIATLALTDKRIYLFLFFKILFKTILPIITNEMRLAFEEAKNTAHL